MVHRGTDKPLHIVPGLLQRGSLPNVMRGEETQVLGVLAGGPATGDALGADRRGTTANG